MVLSNLVLPSKAKKAVLYLGGLGNLPEYDLRARFFKRKFSQNDICFASFFFDGTRSGNKEDFAKLNMPIEQENLELILTSFTPVEFQNQIKDAMKKFQELSGGRPTDVVSQCFSGWIYLSIFLDKDKHTYATNNYFLSPVLGLDYLNKSFKSKFIDSTISGLENGTLKQDTLIPMPEISFGRRKLLKVIPAAHIKLMHEWGLNLKKLPALLPIEGYKTYSFIGGKDELIEVQKTKKIFDKAGINYYEPLWSHHLDTRIVAGKIVEIEKS